MNYRGKDTYKTIFGLIATLISVYFVTEFALNQIIDCVTRDSKQTSSQKTFVNLQDSGRVSLGEGKFQIGVYTKRVFGDNEEYFELDPRLGTLLIGQIELRNFHEDV